MWQVVQFSTVFEDTFVHSQWGEATQMQTMQLFNNNKANTWNPHENSQWRKGFTSVHNAKRLTAKLEV